MPCSGTTFRCTGGGGRGAKECFQICIVGTHSLLSYWRSLLPPVMCRRNFISGRLSSIISWLQLEVNSRLKRIIAPARYAGTIWQYFRAKINLQDDSQARYTDGNRE